MSLFFFSCLILCISPATGCGSMRVPFPPLTESVVTYSTSKQATSEWVPMHITVLYDASFNQTENGEDFQMTVKAAVGEATEYFRRALTVIRTAGIQAGYNKNAPNCPNGTWSNTDYAIKVHLEIEHNVSVIYTPQVVNAVQAHFGCETLEGAELENNGGTGSAFSHWEQRLFAHENMASTVGDAAKMTNITLALFYDSGWYRPNFSVAEEMKWGHNQGCGMVKKSCLGFIKEQEASQLPTYPFCNQRNAQKCSDDRLAVEYCQWKDSKKKPPAEYDYFDPVDNKYPGYEIMDYCPVYRIVRNHTTVRECAKPRLDGESFMYDEELSLQTFSASSRCFLISGNITVIKDGAIGVYSQPSGLSGCYEHRCANSTLMIKTINSTFYPCYHPGQMIHFYQERTGVGIVKLELICPKCEEFCSQCSAPADYGRIGDVEPIPTTSKTSTKIHASTRKPTPSNSQRSQTRIPIVITNSNTEASNVLDDKETSHFPTTPAQSDVQDAMAEKPSRSIHAEQIVRRQTKKPSSIPSRRTFDSILGILTLAFCC